MDFLCVILIILSSDFANGSESIQYSESKEESLGWRELLTSDSNGKVS